MKRLLQTVLTLAALTTALPTLALDREAVQQMLDSPLRELSDKIRDPSRKPLAVLEFIGIEAGMQVLDLYAGGGYYSLLLSAAVGEQGRVFAQNSPRALSFQEDRSDLTAGEALSAKIKNHGLHNLIRLDQPFTELNLPPNSLDVVLVSLVFHDYYNRDARRGEQLLLRLKELLKPGGVVALIDHHGKAGQDNRRLHRIVKEDVLQAIARSGLVLEADSDLLRNPRDDYRRSIFDPSLNRNTDRFLLRIRKPEA